MEITFNNSIEAIEYLKSLDNGIIQDNKSSLFSTKDEKNHINNIFYFSETENSLFYYTVKIYESYTQLVIQETVKHPFIIAVENNDQQKFKNIYKSFTKDYHNKDKDYIKKMIRFAADSCVRNNRWELINYIIKNPFLEHHSFSFVFNSIRYNKVDILKNILTLHKDTCDLSSDCLCQCINYDSIDVAKYLLNDLKIHEKKPNELFQENSWFKRIIRQENNQTKDFILSKIDI